jgi:hypothetical protein
MILVWSLMGVPLPALPVDGLPAPKPEAAENSLFGGLILTIQGEGQAYTVRGFEDVKFLIRRAGKTARIAPERENLSVNNRRIDAGDFVHFNFPGKDAPTEVENPRTKGIRGGWMEGRKRSIRKFKILSPKS